MTVERRKVALKEDYDGLVSKFEHRVLTLELFKKTKKKKIERKDFLLKKDAEAALTTKDLNQIKSC